MAASQDSDISKHMETIREDLATLTKTVTQLVTDTAGIQASLRKKVTNAARQAGAMGEQLVSDAGELGSEALSAATRGATAAVESIEDQISRNPMVAVLGAIGVGFLVGFLTRK